MGIDFVGDKGKAKAASDSTLGLAGQDAMWAVVLTKELWQKSIWLVLLVSTPFCPNSLEGMMQNLSQSWLWPAFTQSLRCKVPRYISSWVLIRTMMKWKPVVTR